MIHARWRNKLELWRPFETPPNLMLGLRKKLEPDSILDLAELMGVTTPNVRNRTLSSSASWRVVSDNTEFEGVFL
jgi:hypothetical protein